MAKRKDGKPRKVRARKGDAPDLLAAGVFIHQAKANGGTYSDGIVTATITDTGATIVAHRLGNLVRVLDTEELARAEQVAAPTVEELDTDGR